MKINSGSYYAAPIKPNFKASLLRQMMQNYGTQNAVVDKNTKFPVKNSEKFLNQYVTAIAILKTIFKIKYY